MLVLITNKKSYMSFRPTTTLNGIMAVTLRCFTEFVNMRSNT